MMRCVGSRVSLEFEYYVMRCVGSRTCLEFASYCDALCGLQQIFNGVLWRGAMLSFFLLKPLLLVL